jgi:hypothetical protein
MLASANRETALKQLAIEHAAVRALIDELTNEEMTRPDTIQYGLYADQELSFKDLLAHLITYEAYSLETITAWKQGQEHWIVEAMNNPTASRKVHYAGIDDRRSLTLTQILDRWKQTQADLVHSIRALTDDEWSSPAPYRVNRPTNLGGVIEVILVAPPRPLYRHLPVHIPDTAAYIRALRGD